MKQVVLVLGLCGLVAVTPPSSAQSQQTAKDPAFDERAMTALTGMTNHLKTLKAFKITSQSSRDEIVDSDMKIQKAANNVISVRLPDRLHAVVRSDDRNLEFFYDGKTFTLFTPEKNLYASTAAPPTVARIMDATRARHGITMPLADFLHMAAGDNFRDEMAGAGYIGTSRVNDVECDHVAVRQADVDWQVWIEKSQTPLPRKLVITTKTEPTQPQYIATLAWDVSPTLEDTLFTFNPPANAARIPFARVKAKDAEQPSPTRR
jgi:hypothetical protein